MSLFPWTTKKTTRTLNDRAIELLLDSPLARQAAADEERQRLARREQLMAERAEARNPDPRVAQLRADADEERRRLRLSKLLVAEGEARVAQLDAEAFSLSCARDNHLGQLETELRRTAHPKLEEFMRDARARENAARWRTEGGGWSGVTQEDISGRRSHEPLATNLSSVARVRLALREAIAEAEQLQLSAASDAEIEARIATWRQELHVPEEPSLETGERRPWLDETEMNFPEIEHAMNPVRRLITPAEDRELDWRLRKEANR